MPVRLRLRILLQAADSPRRQVREWNNFHLPNATFNTTEPYSANADDRTLHELYLWPWYDAVHDGLAAVMCSYNQLNNTQACQNNHLMNDILKGEMGFQGYDDRDKSFESSQLTSVASSSQTTAANIAASSPRSQAWT